MDTIAIIIGVIALLLIWWNLWISIKIVKYLNENGQDASLFLHKFFIKGKIFRYLASYKKISLKNTGKVGELYSLFYISFVLMLIVLLLGIAVVS
jgi:hypothetical protein